MKTMPWRSHNSRTPAEIALRGHHDSRAARDGLEDDRRDGGGTLEGEDLFEVLQCSSAFLFLRRGVKGAAVEEGAEEVDGSGVAVVIGPAASVAGHVDRQVGAAVVAAVGREHLDTARVQTGHPDRVLVRVGTAVGEEDLVQAGGSVLADPMSGPRARLDGGRGRHGAQLCGLLLNSLDDVWVLMADIGDTSCELKSTYSLPSPSHTNEPCARDAAISAILAWDNHK